MKKFQVNSRTFLKFHYIDDENFKIEKLNLNDISMELLQGISSSRTGGMTFIGVLFFICAFIGALLNLPSFILSSKDGEISTPIKVIWRYGILIIGLLPLLINDVLSNFERIWDIIFSNYIQLFSLAFLQTIYVYLVYFSAQKTYIAHTILLCSIPTTFLATWKIAKRARYTSIEYLGIAINVFGAYLCCCDCSGAEVTHFIRKL